MCSRASLRSNPDRRKKLEDIVKDVKYKYSLIMLILFPARVQISRTAIRSRPLWVCGESCSVKAWDDGQSPVRVVVST